MAASQVRTFSLNSLFELELVHVEAERVTYQGRQAVRLIEQGEPDCAIPILSALNFKEGVIETEIAGMPRRDAPQDMRGFVGIAFHVQAYGSRFECFFLRPTNRRADDQLRRNHSTQYISYPDYPWYRLRDESPGVYESYTDFVPGARTPVKIVVSGPRAEFYVNRVEQPCLIDRERSQTWQNPRTDRPLDRCRYGSLLFHAGGQTGLMTGGQNALWCSRFSNRNLHSTG